MRDIEHHYGIRLRKKPSLSILLNRSENYKLKLKAENILKEANGLFVRGNYEQCFALLEQAVKLIPNDHRPFYMLGLIHEEMGNVEKAHTSYFMSALLKKSDSALWRKVVHFSGMLHDDKRRVIALERLYRKQPSRELLDERMECYRRLNKKYWVVTCQIEAFDYAGVDNSIFEEFRDKNHRGTMERLVDRLVKCIRKNEDAQTEYFVRNTILSAYKVEDWPLILELCNNWYADTTSSPLPEIRLISLIARMKCRPVKRKNKKRRKGGNKRTAQRQVSTADIASQAFLFGLEDIDEDLFSHLPGISRAIAESAADTVEDDESTTSPEDAISDSVHSPAYDASDDVPDSLENSELKKGICAILEDETLWTSLSDYKYARDLSEVLFKRSYVEEASECLGKLHSLNSSKEAEACLASIYFKFRQFDTATELYQSILVKDPTDMQAKADLYKIYSMQGKDDLAAKLEVTTKAFEFAEGKASVQKRKYRFSNKECIELRKKNEQARKYLGKDTRKYNTMAQPLLDDFFTNPFVVVKNKHFKSMKSAHEKVPRGGRRLLRLDEPASKKEQNDRIIRIQSLHGLDIDEWFETIKCSILCHLTHREYEQARDLVQRAMNVFIFKEPSYSVPLIFLGIKIATLLADNDLVILICKNWLLIHNYSVMYFLYFLCHIFQELYLHNDFLYMQKNIQRISKRPFPSHPSGRDNHNSDNCSSDTCQPSAPIQESATGGSITVTPPGDILRQSTSMTQSSAISYRISPFLTINSYVPRHLYTFTVDASLEMEGVGRDDITVILAAICIGHTRSRTLNDKLGYARRGIQLLKALDERSPLRAYNLAKAYHFFGYYLQAEQLYLEAIETAPEIQLKRMALFNLSLIFRKTKSRKLLRHLLRRDWL